MSGPNEFLASVASVARGNPDNIAANVFDPAYYATLGEEEQEGLLRCINSGVQNPDSAMGCYACQPEDYDRFKPFFSQVLSRYHRVSEDAVHVNNWSLEGVEGLPAGGVLDLAALGLPELSMRVRVGRNLAAFPLPGAMTLEERCNMENFVLQAFEFLIAMPEYGGRYISITPGHPHEVSAEEYQALVDAHLMFKDMSSDSYLLAAGIAADWPHGRGCYISEDKGFIIWVGEEDHLRIMCMRSGSVLNHVFDRLKGALDVVSSIDGLQFAFSPDYGAVTSCPTNLGTGMRASVHIALPNLTSDGTDAKAKAIAKPLGLSVRGLGGEHTPIGADGTVDISPSARFCITEAEIITALYRGLELLQAAEVEEATGGGAAGADAGMPAGGESGLIIPPPVTPALEDPPDDGGQGGPEEEPDQLREMISKCTVDNLLELLFYTIDFDHDGQLSAEEITNSPFGEVLSVHWDALDTDQNMNVDMAEWTSFFAGLADRIGAADAETFVQDLCWSGDLDVIGLLAPEDRPAAPVAPVPVAVEPEPEPELGPAEQLAVMEEENTRLAALVAAREGEIVRVKGRLADFSSKKEAERAAERAAVKSDRARKPKPPSKKASGVNQGMYKREQQFRQERNERLAKQAEEIEAEKNAELDYVFIAKPAPRSSKKKSKPAAGTAKAPAN